MGQEVIETNAHTLEEVAEGVYFATGNGTLYAASNALIIEREEDVVGGFAYHTSSRASTRSIRVVTNKVTTLITLTFITTANGASAFGDDIEIIGHEVTYQTTGEPANEHTYRSSLVRDSTMGQCKGIGCSGHQGRSITTAGSIGLLAGSHRSSGRD